MLGQIITRSLEQAEMQPPELMQPILKITSVASQNNATVPNGAGAKRQRPTRVAVKKSLSEA